MTFLLAKSPLAPRTTKDKKSLLSSFTREALPDVTVAAPVSFLTIRGILSVAARQPTTEEEEDEVRVWNGNENEDEDEEETLPLVR
mmetsp:Transcript_8780/g.25044  ORF Transcript_8780/g.25044 Transcript_8780/m.25044 type:complete len:86 (-) Transcript_8780:88-345(-)